MPTIGVLGAKGGCGASVIATNLGVAMARDQELVLFDLNPLRGCDDVLLGLSPEHSWADLLPVAQELQDSHLRKVRFPSRSRLGLLQAPVDLLDREALPQVKELALGLGRLSGLMIIDLPSGDGALTRAVLACCDLLLLVSTPDTPALRAANRWVSFLPHQTQSRAGLILNQMDRQHPIQPKAVAASLDLPLLGVLPRDMDAVGGQLAFGRPAVLSRGSSLGRALFSLAARVSSHIITADQDVIGPGPNPLSSRISEVQERADS